MKYILITMLFASPTGYFNNDIDGESMGQVLSFSTLEACEITAAYKKLDPKYPMEVAICKKWPL